MSILLLWSLRASATVVVGLGLAYAMRKRSAATRNLVLRITLAVCLALPLVAAFAPRVAVALPNPVPSPTSVEPERAAAPVPVTQGWSVETSAGPGSAPALVRRMPFRTATFPIGLLLLPFYGLGVGLLALRWLVGFMRLRRIAKEGELFDDGVRRAAIPVPATYGRTILLPLESKGWPEARVRAAILHERAHLRRKDWHWQTLAGLFVCVHWPNPLAWLLLRALRATAEMAADDEAIAQMRPSDYARELLAVAAKVGSSGPAVAMARRGGVADRVATILSVRDRRAPSRRAIAGVLVALAGVGLALAGVTLARRSIVTLRAANDASGQHWDAEGRPLVSGSAFPQNPEGIGPGERWVNLVFDLGDVSPTRGLRIETDAPTRVRVYGPTSPVGHEVQLQIAAPKGLFKTNVRVGLADGAWQEIPRSGGFHRKVSRVIGGRAPQYILAVDVPALHRGEDLRVVARRRDGSEPARIGSGTSLDSAFLQLKGRPADVASVVVQHRPYEWTTLRDVPLRPQLAASRPTDSAEMNGVSLRLIAVRESSFGQPRTWAPDGGIAPEDLRHLQPLGIPRTWVPSHARTLEFVIEAVGRSGDPMPRLDAKVQEAIPNSGVLAPDLDWNAASGTGRFRFAADVPEHLKSLPALQIGLASGPWLAVGDPVSKFTSRRLQGSTPLVEMSARVPPFLRDQEVRLVALDAKGRVLPDRGHYGPYDGRAFVVVDHVKRPMVAGVAFQCRRLTWSAFEDIHLVPNP